jgi:hypothetical protein
VLQISAVNSRFAETSNRIQSADAN